MLFERSGEGQFAPPESYKKNAVVAFGTHDTPTFAGWRESVDLEVKRALDMDAGETAAERTRALTALRRQLADRGTNELNFPGVAKYLASAPSRLLCGVKEQVNLPGTLKQYPNWRQVLPVRLEKIRSRPELAAIASIMCEAGRSS
jgi:4-alpha-glucanotransferase